MNELKLLIRLTNCKNFTLREIMEYLDISERSVYRYMKMFREFGIKINNKDGFYNIDKQSVINIFTKYTK